MERLRNQVDTSLTRTVARSVVVGNILTVLLLGVLYANYRIFEAYISSFLLALLAAEALAESRDRLVRWLSTSESEAEGNDVQRPRRLWHFLLNQLGKLQQAVRGKHWFVWLLSGTALLLLTVRVQHGGFLVFICLAVLGGSALCTLAAARFLVRLRWIHARTAAATLLLAAVVSLVCIFVLIFVTGVVQDLVGAARALARLAQDAATWNRIDPQGILAKGLEQLQTFLAAHVEVAERFALRFRDVLKDLGFDMENTERWWVKSSDPSWWRDFLTGDLHANAMLRETTSLRVPSWQQARTVAKRLWEGARKNVTPGSIARLGKHIRLHASSEQIYTGARLVMIPVMRLAQAFGILLTYSDGIAAFLAMFFFLLRQPGSVVHALVQWIPFQNTERNRKLEQTLRTDLHRFVWSALSQLYLQSLFAWCVFVTFGLELEFLVALCVGVSVLIPVLPGPLLWTTLLGLPQVMMRTSLGRLWRSHAALAFVCINLVGQKVLVRFSRNADDEDAEQVQQRADGTLTPTNGLLTLSALLGWRILGGLRGALIASCCIFLTSLLVQCLVDDSSTRGSENKIPHQSGGAA